MEDYIRDPAQIYRQSFATVEREADLGRFNNGQRQVAIRLIHSCGMIDIVDDLVFSPGAVEAGIQALQAGCKIYCDVEMVRSGIIQARLPENCQRICTLNDQQIEDHSAKIGNTRSASGVDFWEDLAGSICVIGNAPTALFRLMERLDERSAKPALIIGMPVGFIGAEESKAELVGDRRGTEFIVVKGRRGGSAMASSAVNGLAGLLQ